MAFELQFLGATERVTGSLYLLRAGEAQIVLECGLVQGVPDEEAHNREPFPFEIDAIDAVVISHSHIDHSGRVPLLDHKLVELIAGLPNGLKRRGDEGKYLLKRIARGIVPDAVIDRPKGYFPVPALKFVRGEFLEFMKSVLLSDRCRQRSVYQTDYLDKLLKDPEKYLTRIQGNKLWHMALLEFWLQTHVDDVSVN